MFLQAPSSFRNSLMVSYLNAFTADPARGVLNVPRLLPHDDVDPRLVMITRETFRPHEAADVAEEIEEVFRGVKDHFRRRPSGSSAMWAGSWRVSSPDSHHQTMEGPGGRLVEILSRPELLTFRVGHNSQDSRLDREARLSVSISRGGGEPNLRSVYDIGFGSRTFDGLLRFLGLELTADRLEYMSRRQLWEALRQRLEADGFKTDGYEADQHGLSWRTFDAHGDETSTGQLWTDDVYPSLHISYPSAQTPLSPSFIPLWQDTVDRIRSSGSRRSVRPPESARMDSLTF
jgi:hypothetical protein